MQNLLNLKRTALVFCPIAVDITASCKPSVKQHYVQVMSAYYHYKISNLDLCFSEMWDLVMRLYKIRKLLSPPCKTLVYPVKETSILCWLGLKTWSLLEVFHKKNLSHAGVAEVLLFYLSVWLFLPMKLILFFSLYLSLCQSLRINSRMPLNGATEKGDGCLLSYSLWRTPFLCY